MAFFIDDRDIEAQQRLTDQKIDALTGKIDLLAGDIAGLRENVKDIKKEQVDQEIEVRKSLGTLLGEVCRIETKLKQEVASLSTRTHEALAIATETKTRLDAMD
jgi:phage-related minor tail protein